MGRRGATAGLGLLLAVAACTNKSALNEPAPNEPAPSVPAPSVPAPSVPAPSASDSRGPDSRASSFEAVSCSDSIDHVTELPVGYRLVAGAVAVPTDRMLQASPSGENDPAAKLFAKWGLMVRTGETVQIAVAPGWTNKAQVGWGAPGAPAPAVRVTACASGSWSVFAGGIWVAEPACVPLVIRAGGSSEEARFPIGVACSGPT